MDVKLDVQLDVQLDIQLDGQLDVYSNAPRIPPSQYWMLGGLGGWIFVVDKFKRTFDQKSIQKHLLNEVLEVQIHQNLLKGGKRRAKKGKGAPKTATRRPKGSQAAPKSSKMSPKLIQN